MDDPRYTAITGITFGAFDLLHAGHVSFIKECRAASHFLIVGLHVDPSVERASKNKPAQSVYERYLQLEACKYVDKIIPYETEKDIENILAISKVNRRFLGTEYIDVEYTAKKLCEKLNIEVIFIPRMHSYSSSELRQRMRRK